MRLINNSKCTCFPNDSLVQKESRTQTVAQSKPSDKNAEKEAATSKIWQEEVITDVRRL